MEQNISESGMDDASSTKKEFQSLDEFVEQWVYETIREDGNKGQPFDSAA